MNKRNDRRWIVVLLSAANANFWHEKKHQHSRQSVVRLFHQECMVRQSITVNICSEGCVHATAYFSQSATTSKTWVVEASVAEIHLGVGNVFGRVQFGNVIVVVQKRWVVGLFLVDLLSAIQRNIALNTCVVGQKLLKHSYI